jgi:hypothetical protein
MEAKEKQQQLDRQVELQEKQQQSRAKVVQEQVCLIPPLNDTRPK